MDTIFIQIASYRDRELVPTVLDALAQAAHPERLSFGICWQYQTEEELQYIEPLKNLKNCRIDAVSAAQSRGACWARSRTQKLWRGERYTLQIDSHIVTNFLVKSYT
ncbi:GlcNAc-transferase family protein [Gloeothece verrucosa]|uniref:GlcNAc-transferase family protein n=1 Tax=Gloeothece verrucosa TaxID=2546359 RepID=UPI00017E2B83|nr:GlcNAc-transferase family protein [Gloeothece verrucosa]